MNEKLQKELLESSKNLSTLKGMLWCQDSLSTAAKDIVVNELKNAGRKPKNRAYGDPIMNFAMVQKYFSNSGNFSADPFIF